MHTSDFDYDLPRELIATHPAVNRDESRLLVLDRNSGAIEHRQFGDLADYLKPRDLLVMNDSRVLKARLRGVRDKTGAAIEVLLLEPVEFSAEGRCRWSALCRPAKKFHKGEWLSFGGNRLAAEVAEVGPEGERVLEFAVPDLLPMLEQIGEIPLPPYIVQRRREIREQLPPGGAMEAADAERYQTVYAREPGSVAAPTAGLHFTPRLLQKLGDTGIDLAWVTLHVGAGTFKPVEVEDPSQHPIHTEYCEVPSATADAIQRARDAGGRVIAVGTTTVRTLESAWDDAAQQFFQGRMTTRLLILPGYKYQVVDAMITNFHLPRSSLLMMISAFAGHEKIMHAYRQAIENKYRFYSYGDAMLIKS